LFKNLLGCCHPSFGEGGKDECWRENDFMTWENCCGMPILPKRCVKENGIWKQFMLQVNYAGELYDGVWSNFVEDHSDCASLDEFSIYLQTAGNLGSDKHSGFHDYLRVVEPFLSDFNANARVLEMGVAHGHSLALWSLWFPNGTILGVDNDHEVQMMRQLYARGANITGNVQILVGDAHSQTFVDHYLVGRQFDVIVDDASHDAEDQIRSWRNLKKDW